MGLILVTDSLRGRRRRHSHQLLGHPWPQAAAGPGHGTGHSAQPHPADRQRGGGEREMPGPARPGAPLGPQPGRALLFSRLGHTALPQSHPDSVPHSLAGPAESAQDSSHRGDPAGG